MISQFAVIIFDKEIKQQSKSTFFLMTMKRTATKISNLLHQAHRNDVPSWGQGLETDKRFSKGKDVEYKRPGHSVTINTVKGEVSCKHIIF